MRRQRREIEVFSLSFLDVITCGFGTMILLIMISKQGEPLVLEPAPQDLRGVVASLQEQLFEIRGESRVLNRDLNAKREQLSQWKLRVARLTSELNGMDSRRATMRELLTDKQALRGELEQALQNLTEEMQRLLAQRQQVDTEFVGGIPVDSEYIIFVIDTSGSMFQYAWDRVMQEVEGVLRIYPKVKGIQVMDDQGGYMFKDYRRDWIPDSPSRRKLILQRLRTFNPFSNSSPVEGINRAIRDFYKPDQRISIYVFGDDFTGDSIERVLDVVDQLNPKNESGVPQIRIHAIGFPVQFANTQQQITGMRFAHLMRELAHRNMGTFVGLNDFRGNSANSNYNIITPF
jgi:hypothetical protein